MMAETEKPINLLQEYKVYIPDHYDNIIFSRGVMPKEEFSKFFTSEAGVRASNIDFFSCTLFYSVFWSLSDRKGIYFFSNAESRGSEDPRPPANGGYLVWREKVIRILFHEFHWPNRFLFKEENRNKIQVYWAIFQIDLLSGWGEVQSFKGAEIETVKSSDLEEAKSMIYSLAKGQRSITQHYVYRDCDLLFIHERLDVKPVVVEEE